MLRLHIALRLHIGTSDRCVSPAAQGIHLQTQSLRVTSLLERGNYLICEICFWEDDGQDIDELDMKSAANHGITLVLKLDKI
ncbi:MAG: CPCC family cysteine-rich protein [Microcoleaceae cyanobacterium]